VEVTKLSLLLTLMEGEIVESRGELFLKSMSEALLPNLDNNIKCGNSLIGTDFYKDKDLTLFGKDEQRKINCFDWEEEFPQIFKGKIEKFDKEYFSNHLTKGVEKAKEAIEISKSAFEYTNTAIEYARKFNLVKENMPVYNAGGGFDVVIGNPPYGALLSKNVKEYLKMKYLFVSDFETAQFFIAESEKLTKMGGDISFIIPNTMFLNLFAQNFRQFVINSFAIKQITNLSEINVFEGATVRTVIPFFQKGSNINTEIKLIEFQNPQLYYSMGSINQIKLEENDKTWITILSNNDSEPVKNKIKQASVPLNEILEISQGLIPYDKYRGHDEYTIKNRIWHSDNKKDPTYKPELRGGDVTRYSVIWNGKQWISYGPWLAAPRKPEFFNEPRLLFREITDPKNNLLHVAFTNEEYYNNPGNINCISRGNDYSLLYLLGICASRLIAYWHFNSSPKARKGVFPKILVNDVRNIPIHTINFKNNHEKSKHDRMVNLVEQMFKAQKEAHDSKSMTETEQKLINQRINILDKQIDTLVYELYGLTEDEIKIVEGE
jgi:adenine-specific DNA-methyltransferase